MLTSPGEAVLHQRRAEAAHGWQYDDARRGRGRRHAEEKGHRQAKVEKEEQQQHARREKHKR